MEYLVQTGHRRLHEQAAFHLSDEYAVNYVYDIIYKATVKISERGVGETLVIK